ncbi:MAG: hypothetical protein ABIY51_15180 [Ferruginibacter sp.]
MEIVPKQEQGIQSDTIATRNFASEDEAHDFFLIAKQRLLQISNWKNLIGNLSADFYLCDSHGDEVQRTVEKNDYIKIDIPGPGTVAGNGNDWVHVESLQEESNEKEEMTCVKVRPASSPLNDNKDIAHFFDDSATSSFIVKRRECIVSAEVHGRNEKPNVETEALQDKIRNTIIATAAATGFSKLQWKLLAEGLIKEI